MSMIRTNGHETIAVEPAPPEHFGVLCVPPAETSRVWPHVWKYIAAGQKAGGEPLDRIATLTDLKLGYLLLWVIYEDQEIVGALITRLVRGNNDLVCHWVTLGGRNMQHWLHLQPVIEAYARAEGCSRMRLYGRAGWKRVLREYRQTGVILEKRL